MDTSFGIPPKWTITVDAPEVSKSEAIDANKANQAAAPVLNAAPQVATPPDALLSQAVSAWIEQEEGESKVSPDMAPSLAKIKKDKRDPAIAYDSMQRNLRKALLEHRRMAEPTEKTAFLTLNQFENLSTQPQPDLQLNSYALSSLGEYRTSNEDAYFYEDVVVNETTRGTIAGVLDGHLGKDVAQFVQLVFATTFKVQLARTPDNVRLAFQNTVDQVHGDIKRLLPASRAGCTAVICYFDVTSGRLFTMTLADSEAFVLRFVDGAWKLIPLSPLRGWWQPKEAARAHAKDLVVDGSKPPNNGDYPRISAKEIETRRLNGTLEPKQIRFGIHPFLNVSRSFGDLDSFADGSGIIQDIKATVCQLFPKDRVILCCDGVTDYLHKHVIRDVLKQADLPFAVGELVRKAKISMRTDGFGDNITVIAMDVLQRKAT